MAAPVVIVETVCDQTVANDEVTIVSPVPNWEVHGTVQHDNNKPVTAMYFMIGSAFPTPVPIPTAAGQPGTTTPVPFTFNMTPISSDGDYLLYVTAANDDGSTTATVTIHAVGFDINPIPIPSPPPVPVMPVH